MITLDNQTNPDDFLRKAVAEKEAYATRPFADEKCCTEAASGNAAQPSSYGIHNQLMQQAEMLDRAYYQVSDKARDLKSQAEGLRSLAGCLPQVLPEPAYRALRHMLHATRHLA